MQKNSHILWLINIIQILVICYAGLRLFILFFSDFALPYKILAYIFFGAEVFILVHSLAYLENIKNVLTHPLLPNENVNPSLELQTYPPVGIVVASYREPLEIIENTLICLRNLTYPNKKLYLLDDTRYDLSWDTPEKQSSYKEAVENLCKILEIDIFRRKWHHAKAGIINDFLEFMHHKTRDDFVIISHSSQNTNTDIKYLIVFDADMNPFPYFVETLVNAMEKQPRMAFIQTPQYYTNFEYNRVARAAGLMQVFFFEYICESKGLNNLMIFCGTNAILRIEALEDVGGIDLNSVTEDFLTAFNMHLKGWESTYLHSVCAFGIGPEDLGGFFKQQYRWALGTVGLLPTLIKKFITNPFKHPFILWREYFISSSYYLIGWAYLIFLLAPTLYIFLNFPIYMFPTSLYILLLIPYNLIMFYVFFSTLQIRGYSIKETSLGIIFGVISTPVYIKASIAALCGYKGKFQVTPKGESHCLPMIDLWPQIALAIFSFSSITWATLRIIFEQEPILGLSLNIFWCMYYFLIFSTVFYFNQPLEESNVEYANIFKTNQKPA